MGSIEKAWAKPATADLERFLLRRFVEGLGDELDIIEAVTDLAGVAAILAGNPRAVMLRSVGPEGRELVGNVTASRARVARAFAQPGLPHLTLPLPHGEGEIDVRSLA